jgi:hypothetical protein
MSERKKSKKEKLPNELVYMPNKDKQNHERWTKNRCIMNFPKPYRMVLCGSPGSGKTNFIYNVIMRADPPFERLFVFHPDSESLEYSLLGEHVEMLTEMPIPTFCDPSVKNLLILDDICFKNLSKIDKANLDRLTGYTSTHRNCTVIITAQDSFNIAPSVRRNASIFVLWKNSPDLSSLATLASRVGLNAKTLFNIFDTCMKEGSRDSLCLDLTMNSPAAMRINGFKKIQSTKQIDESKKNRMNKFSMMDKDDSNSE